MGGLESSQGGNKEVVFSLDLPEKNTEKDLSNERNPFGSSPFLIRLGEFTNNLPEEKTPEIEFNFGVFDFSVENILLDLEKTAQTSGKEFNKTLIFDALNTLKDLVNSHGSLKPNVITKCLREILGEEMSKQGLKSDILHELITKHTHFPEDYDSLDKDLALSEATTILIFNGFDFDFFSYLDDVVNSASEQKIEIDKTSIINDIINFHARSKGVSPEKQYEHLVKILHKSCLDQGYDLAKNKKLTKDCLKEYLKKQVNYDCENFKLNLSELVRNFSNILENQGLSLTAEHKNLFLNPLASFYSWASTRYPLAEADSKSKTYEQASYLRHIFTKWLGNLETCLKLEYGFLQNRFENFLGKHIEYTDIPMSKERPILGSKKEAIQRLTGEQKAMMNFQSDYSQDYKFIETARRSFQRLKKTDKISSQQILRDLFGREFSDPVGICRLDISEELEVAA